MPVAPPTDAQLATAAGTYYDLVASGDLERGWELLSPAFQERSHGGFDSYERWWTQDVATVGVQGRPRGDAESGTTDLTLRYRLADGRTIVEDATLTFVQDDTKAFKDPQITWHQGYFDLAPDEALVVEVTPPECDYWMIALHNHWMETLDYTHHQITLNSRSSVLEDDGSVRWVVAHEDPGVPNWLDTAGHQRGTVGVRWVGPDVADILPATRVVKVSELT